MATASHSTALSPRRQRAAAAYEAVTQWHAPVRQTIRQAVHRRTINVPTGEFLHWLLSQAGDKPYCAIPKAEIAVLYRKSLSSIKLYIRTGVEQGILRTTGTRIYFVQLEAPATEKSYDELVEEATALAARGQILEAGLLLQRAAELRKRSEKQDADQDEEPASEAEQPPLFLAEDESKNCPDSDNSLPDHPLKTLSPFGGGGKRAIKKLSPDELAAIQALPHVAKLRAVGSVVQQCWIRLRDRPIAEIDRACKLALDAKWADDPGAVAIWYADQIAAGLIPLDDPTPPVVSPAVDAPKLPADPLDVQWTHIQNALRQQVSAGEYETWIKETSLIQVAEGRAIVGTPNIFARDQLAETYAPLILEQLRAGGGDVAQVVVVLDSSLGPGGRP